MTRKVDDTKPVEESAPKENGDNVYTQSKSIDLQTEFSAVQFKQEDTRGRFALFFLIGFFITIAAGLAIGVAVDSTKIKNVSDMILTISGVLSGPLGFIIGYYFKKQEEASK